MPLAEFVQHDSPLGRWQFARWTTEPPLTSSILDLWDLRSEGSYSRERLVPRSYMDLLINLGEPHRLLSRGADRPARTYRGAWISGLHEQYLEIESPLRPWLMGARFTPAGPMAVLGVPAGELANEVIDLDLLLGPSVERLRQQLIGARSVQDRFRTLERFFCQRLNGKASARPEVTHTLDRLFRSAGRARMRTLATETGLSQKHLIHLFREQVGLAPKRYARIVRFNALLRQMAPDARPDWADLAAMYGFYDQAHFVRDFREFTGTTPTDFLRTRGPDGTSVVLD
jgi:AraC-like DNA-binding protein